MSLEVDIQVAGDVMGWPTIGGNDSLGGVRSRAAGYIYDGVPYRFQWLGFVGTAQFRPTTDVADDYAVLCHLRENKDDAMFDSFCVELARLVKLRDTEYRTVSALAIAIQHYTPGDYARAALAAKKPTDS